MDLLRAKSVLLFSLVVFPLFLETSVYGADVAWRWENPLPTQNDLYGVWGSSDDDIFAVGNSGAILHFDGNTWSEMNASFGQPYSPGLFGIWGASQADVFAVRNQGLVRLY